MKKGFTLVELLVVIAIIGVLAAAVLVSLAGTRPRARDARRRSDLQNMSRAIQLYADDSASTTEDAVPYVNSNSAIVPTGPGTGQALNYDTLDAIGYGVELVPTYIQALPVPPTNNNSDTYGYMSFLLDMTGVATTSSDSFRYRLGAWEEVNNVTYDLSGIPNPTGSIIVSQ